MRTYVGWLLRLIGPLLLIYFVVTVDLRELGATLAGTNIWAVLLSFALMAVFVWVKSWRWNILMRELDLAPPPLRYSMVLYTIGLFLGGTTPGQSGDFLKALYLRQRGLPMAPVMFSILLDRLFDFLIMIPLAMLSLVVFAPVLPDVVRYAAIGFAAVFLVGTPVLIIRRTREWLFARVLAITPGRFRPAIARWRDEFAPLDLGPGLALLLLGVSLGSATSTMIRVGLLFVALDLWRVPILAIVASTALVALVQVLPISFSGVGVRDGILIAVLGLYGYTQAQALSLSALFLLVNIQHIVIGFLFSLRYPLKASRDAVEG